jgi:lysophospholipid acyltransferase 7
MTLKVVGVAFEIHDAYIRAQTLEKSSAGDLSQTQIDRLKLETEFVSVDGKLSFLKLFAYSYCYIGILTGPYFKYITYHDWLHFKYSDNIDHVKLMFKRGNTLPLIIVGFLVISQFVSLKDPITDENFYEHSLVYRMAFMTLVFTLFRFRFYVAWIFAEFSCYTAAFAVYPTVSMPQPGHGPTNLEALKTFVFDSNNKESFSFLAIKCIDEYQCETSVTVKGVLKKWNQTVQYWMAHNVYKRVPPRFKPAGQPITMFVSAYWHGLHPGYYLALVSTTPCILAESLMERNFKRRFLNPKYFRQYDLLMTYLFRTRQFDYMSIGFILLTWEDTIKYWSSVFFVGHVTCAALIVFAMTLKLVPRDKVKEAKE